MPSASTSFAFVIGFAFGVFLYSVTSPPKNDEVNNFDNKTKNEPPRFSIDRDIIVVKTDLDEEPYFAYWHKLNKYLESSQLYDLIHVTCVVFVQSPENVFMINSTWGTNCNSIFFYSTEEYYFFETNVISYKNKWQYFCEVMRDVWWSSHIDIEWVIFSSDDVFVIPEHIRHYVSSEDFNKPFYYFHNSEFFQEMQVSREEVILFSKGAMKSLVSKFNTTEACRRSKDINDHVLKWD